MNFLTRLKDNILVWAVRNQKIPDYVKIPMKNYTFDEWFDLLGVKHFTSEEFTEYFQVHRRGVSNSTPPREMWGNIVATLKIVDALRTHYGRPVVILSSYRSPEYNAAIDGAAARSFHMQFRALDIAVAGKSPRQVFDTLKSWRNEGKFFGGLGLYSSFVHIDTRGTNATWGA